MPTSRRTFLSQAALLSASLDSLAFAAPKPAQGFSLKVMATNWGFKGPIADFCRKAKETGYDGIEVWLPADPKDRPALLEAVQAQGLSLGLLCGSGSPDPATHYSQFSRAVAEAVVLKPLYINCHSGKDFHDFERNKACIDLTVDLSKASGIPIYHETHRGRALFAAHVTRGFVEKTPGLRLTLDISHWCNVHESLLADQRETLDIVLPRVDHLHARIGHPEGPQVSDPRAPEWKNALDAHLGWWDRIATRKRQEGRLLTILTEFGPPDYMQTLPYTRQPVADQWDINAHMMQMLRSRYAS
jgi:sugar phosphate isomerase/epimerase